MWEKSERGLAEFRANGWKLVVRADEQGIQLLTCRDPRLATAARLWLPDTPLAACGERFVRGDALHLTFADTDSEPVALELVLMAVEADQERLILESVISLKTSLLDSHPAVELQLGAGHPGRPRWGDTLWGPAVDAGSALWLQPQPKSRAENPRLCTSVFCEDRDRLSLDSGMLAGAGRLRFFGDFLEKGVIRKVQPWWVWSSEPVTPRLATGIAGQLAARPLPLAS